MAGAPSDDDGAGTAVGTAAADVTTVPEQQGEPGLPAAADRSAVPEQPVPPGGPRTVSHAAPRRRRRWSRWSVLLPALAPLVVFAWWLTPDRLIAPGDGGAYYLPLHEVAARIWSAGHVPMFNAYEYAGTGLLAMGQAGVLYLPNVVFLIFPTALANNLSVVLSLVIAALGAALLARRLTDGDPVAAVVSGIGFGLCGFMFARLGHQSIIATIAWLPLALLGLDQMVERFRVRSLVLCAAAIAMAGYAGHSQMLAELLLAMGCYAAVLAVTGGRRWLRPIAFGALGVACGLLLAAAQLLPTYDILDASYREHFDYATAMSYSVPKTHVLLQVFPYLFGSAFTSGPYVGPYHGTWNLTEVTAYPGAAVLVLACAGLVALRRDRRAWGVLAMGVVAFLLLLGPGTPLSKVVYHVPVLGQFRAWNRYSAVSDLAAALLAGYGVHALRTAGARTRRVAAAFAGAGALVIVLAAVVGPRLGSVKPLLIGGSAQRHALLYPVLAALVAAVVATGLVWRRRVAARVLSVVVVLVVGVDLVMNFGWWYEWRVASQSVQSLAADRDRAAAPQWGAVTDDPGGVDRYLYIGTKVDELPIRYGRTDVKGLLSANGFDPLGPREYSVAVGEMNYWGHMDATDEVLGPGSHVLDLLRVTTLLSEDGAAPPPAGSPVSAPRQVAGTPVLRYEYTPKLPDAFVVGAARTTSRQGALDALWGKAPLDPASEVVLEKGCSGCAVDQPGSAGTVTSYRPAGDSGVARATVRADRAGILVLSQAWYPGWRAKVDGHSVPVLRADGLVIGVPVAAGTHTVELTYRAPGIRAGGLLAVLTAFGLLVAAVVSWRTGRWSGPGGLHRREAAPAPAGPTDVGGTDVGRAEDGRSEDGGPPGTASEDTAPRDSGAGEAHAEGPVAGAVTRPGEIRPGG